MAMLSGVHFEGHQKPWRSIAISTEISFYLYTRPEDRAYAATLTWEADEIGDHFWHLGFTPALTSFEVALLGVALAPLLSPEEIR